jgi:hypothetical protein
MQSKTKWTLLAVAAWLSAAACDGGSVGASSDAAVDRVGPTIKLDAPGAGDASARDASPGADSGQPICHVENGACDTSDDLCCEGYACGTTHLVQTPHCMKICGEHAECTTGCCSGLGDSGITVCLPQVFCPDLFCSSEDQRCGIDEPCCDGLACAVLGTAQPTSLCKEVCTQHSACATGCCAPLGGSGVSVCLPQNYCPSVFCLAEDESCLEGDPCCEGLVCVRFETDPPTSACRPICEQHSECASSCCVPLGVNEPSACLDKIYCGG